MALATWNSQALFARKRHRHISKDLFVRRLLRHRDAVLLTDTHGLEGATAAWSCPADCVPYFTPGSSRRAGVGVVVSKRFLSRFQAAEPAWEVIVPGRAAVLRLRGAEGRLDLFVLYFPTGKVGEVEVQDAAVQADLQATIRQQRLEMRSRVAAAMAPQASALSVLMGDFNWVTEERGRFNLESRSFTGAADAPEERHWQETVLWPTGAYEVRQDDYTHENAVVRSRIDRVYWNAFHSEQLDRVVTCSALEWVPQLSAHRPLALARRAPQRERDAPRPLQPGLVNDAQWPVRVAAAFAELCAAAPQPLSGIGRSALLRKAMRMVAARMQCEASLAADAAHDHEDQAGIAMRFVRAAETGRIGVMRKCLRALPRLADLSPDPLALAFRHGAGLAPYKTLAADLAREAALRALADFHREQPNLDEHERAHRRGRIHQMLRRVAPGRTSSLQSVMAENGEILTEPAEMAEVLRRHWARVFARRRIDEDKLREWIQDDRPPVLPGPEAPCWMPQLEHVRRALNHSPNSMPGPDGLTFLAWRRLGHLAEDVLMGALLDLTSAAPPGDLASFLDPPDPHEAYNASFMVLLPKSPAGTTATGMEYFRPEDTRPLNIVNVDNRLLCNAVRYCLEGILPTAAEPEQRGFIPGRSLLANVVDIDEEMAHQALRSEVGAAIFFDFKAAFPSVAHQFLRLVLQAAGLPAGILRFVDHLYSNNFCSISLGGRIFRGFELQAGIRQGCPLSPALFALATGTLLRRLRRLDPTTMQRAYADDLAMVMPHLMRALPHLAGTFHEFADISGLVLNLGKTVIVPLAPVDLQALRLSIVANCPGWQGVRVEHQAKYLGFILGPARGDLTFDGPFRKVLRRAEEWGRLGVGLFGSATAYKTYVISLLTFVLQLDALPVQWPAAEERALRALVPGLGQWAGVPDLHQLARLGFPTGFPDLVPLSIAMKTRVAQYEDRAHGGLRVRRRNRALEEAWRRSTTRAAMDWTVWLDSCFVRQLAAARRRVTEAGIDITELESELAGGQQRPWPRGVDRQVRKKFQKTLCHRLTSLEGVQAEAWLQHRVRHKMDRWRCAMLPRRRADRAYRVLQLLGSRVPPRVWAALWRTLWNGWATNRRLQGRGAVQSCIYGCPADAPDSIEHYAVCPRLADAALTALGLPRVLGPAAIPEFLALDPVPTGANAPQLVLKAVRVAAAYRAHTLVTHGQVRQGVAALEAFAQFTREAVRGHARAGRDLDHATAGVHSYAP